jgi:hypothetical protein
MDWAIVPIIAALYLLPTAIAERRQVARIGSVAVVNIFLGWTMLGWIAALAWACGGAKRA